MRNRLPSPALIIAVLALVVALGGTSYAALKLGKNTVGAKQLKKGAVRSKKVADGSLLARDFKAGQLPAGATGPQGVPGPAGEQGATGPAGPTQGAAHGYADPPPGAQALAPVDKVDITTKTAGSLQVTANLSSWLSGCPGPHECHVYFGLYVDGNPVPGTKMQAVYAYSPDPSVKDFQNVSITGIANGIPAGTHTVAMRLINLPSGPSGAFGEDLAGISAVLLGG